MRSGLAPEQRTNVFALDSDYAMGVLTSRIHTDWAAKKSSTLEDRIRYTPSSAFDTFPWPHATDNQRRHVGDLAVELLEFRAMLCSEHEIGLTTLYNRVDLGAFEGRLERPLHQRLDVAVLGIFGWEGALLDDLPERNRQLYDLNARIVAGEVQNGQPW